MSKVLILGDGKLATEILKQEPRWHYISRKKDGIDICNLQSYAGYLKNYDVIINSIAYTDTYNTEREQHWNVNYKAVVELADYCQAFHKKLCQISTDFVYSNSNHNAKESDPPSNCDNWYAYTKLLADGHVQMRNKNNLILRTSFKPRPFPYEKAYVNMIGNFDYTDVIADLIIRVIKKNGSGIFNIGTKTKTMLDLARQTNPNVVSANGLPDPSSPDDVSMDISKMNNFLGIDQ